MSHHQIDPKTVMAGNEVTGEWVYLDSVDEKVSPAPVLVPAELITGPEYTDSEDDDCHSDYSNEGRLERAYESDEDLDRLGGDESDDAAFEFRELLDRLRSLLDADDQVAAGAAPALTVDDYDLLYVAVAKYLDGSLDGGSTYRDPSMETLNGGGGYGDYYGGYPYGYGGGGGGRHYGGGGLSDYGYGSGRGDGHLSDYDYGSGRGYYGGLSDSNHGSGGGYYSGLPADSDHGSRCYGDGGGHLSDFDYGSGRDDGHLSDYDYGSGRGYYGGISDLDSSSSRRGHYGAGPCYGGLSDLGYGSRGRRGYYHEDEGYYGHFYLGNWYPAGGLHPPMSRPYYVPRVGMSQYQYPPFSPMPEAAHNQYPPFSPYGGGG